MNATKYDDALTIAISEIEGYGLYIDDIEKWSESELFEWLEIRGFRWVGDGWEYVGDSETEIEAQ